jgi:glycosyltransferase involved in cell wall biosynthesis
VSDDVPDVLPALRAALPTRLVRWSERRYSRLLPTCDLIISPKRLVNAYELSHTEYKITLGMAVGLPAVASPQQSYVEAIGYAGGGVVADEPDEWRDALERLVASPRLRAELGAQARRTVRERYATPVVARQYGELLCLLV